MVQSVEKTNSANDKAPSHKVQIFDKKNSIMVGWYKPPKEVQPGSLFLGLCRVYETSTMTSLTMTGPFTVQTPTEWKKIDDAEPFLMEYLDPIIKSKIEQCARLSDPPSSTFSEGMRKCYVSFETSCD